MHVLFGYGMGVCVCVCLDVWVHYYNNLVNSRGFELQQNENYLIKKKVRPYYHAPSSRTNKNNKQKRTRGKKTKCLLQNACFLMNNSNGHFK